MTFVEMREANLRRFRDVWPNEHDWTPADWLVCVTAELGEVAHVLKDGRKYAPAGNVVREMVIADLADEIADTLLYLDMLASRCGIDLELAVRTKFNQTSLKVGSNVIL